MKVHASSMEGWTKADAEVTEGHVITPNRSAALAFTLSAINPKAIALVVTASLAVTRSAATFLDTALNFLFFLVVASVAVAIPVIYRVMGGDDAEARLVRWKGRLIERRAEVTAGVLFLLGVVFIAKGLAGLLA